ncbi:MAG: aldoxime dehydratase [Gammaproteobacteria bacterium]|jgi:aldoxime dehydratase
MSTEKLAPKDLPEDYPGRIVRFPDGSEKLVIALFGAQGQDKSERLEFIENCTRLAALNHGPARIERGECVDSSGVPTSLLIAYWSDIEGSKAWQESDEFTRFWGKLPILGDTGFFVERITIPQERFNYAAGTEDKHGSAAVFPLEPCSTFGYWGAYRDRLPASATDQFESRIATVSITDNKQTRGQRLSVKIPDNLCYIREGQGWGNCDVEERKIWDEHMNPVIDTWVERLRSNPVATGCLSVRDCAEFDATSGEAIDRRTQIAFLQSLGYIEQAARTDPAHLAVHGAFVKMYREPRFTPQMHVWVEVGVMKEDDIETEYLNCHPNTGLLPYFEHQIKA